MADSTTIKSGTFCLQEKKFLRSQQRQEKFCVLYDKSSDKHPHLDLYESRDAFDKYKSKGKKCDKQIDLQGVKYIKQSTQTVSKGNVEYQIELKCRSGKHVLLFDGQRDKDEWFAVLNSTVDLPVGCEEDSSSQPYLDDDAGGSDDEEITTINQMYQSSGDATRFEVEVQDTPLAKLFGIVGKKMLLVSGTDMAFEDPTSKFITASFQMAWLRRFGVKNGLFTFDVGRKCPNGEGIIHCKSTSNKAIHDLLTKASSSRSHTVATANVKPSAISKKGTKIKEPDLKSGIGEPTLLANGRRLHPGQVKPAMLIPLPNDQDVQRSGHTPPTPKRGNPPEVVSRHSTKEQDQGERTEIGRRMSEKHGDSFTRVLEEKLQHPNVEDVESKSIDSKHEKKEKEKDRKSKKKEEQKAKAKEESAKKKKNKKEKDQSKGSGKEASSKQQPVPDLYEIVDTLDIPPSSPTMAPTEPLYDEAMTTTTKTPPKVKAKPSSVKTKGATANNASDGQYESDFTSSHAVEPVEYAQPYVKGRGAPVQVDPIMYSDVKDVKENAWKKYGRKEEEEHHEEDYSNIKNVRDELKNNPVPPPIPQKNYSDEDDDETYDNLNTKTVNHVQTDSTNIYGTASAHSVGPLPPGVPDRRSVGSDSGESDTGGGDEDPHYDGYEDPQVVAARSQASKFSVKTTKQQEDSLYDEVA